ncbi:radical SAM protein [Ornithinimicrobium murale]|uniref:radical SAM protein n=1 Tax=Ornithinimicrobium murale TaxID=1050153 RepID=UPI00192D41C0|nr:radical SAM protein [Ornithinimicrobium murale]
MSATTSLALPTSRTSTEHWDGVVRYDSSEGNVSKHVFTTGNAVAESVLYRYPTFADRTVICCSTQSGCPVGCRFCGAGDAFVRNLTTAEIVDQPFHLLEDIVASEVASDSIGSLQIMFMSMGEPLLNLKALTPAIRELNERYPGARLLVSTSGPRVDYEPFHQLSEQIDTVGLQFSVHESTDEARDTLVPFKAKLTLAQMAQTGEQWAQLIGRRPFFNYCVHDRNDTDADVARLRDLFDPAIWEATLSVICERDETMTVAHARQRSLTEGFMTKMLTAGYSTRMFDPAGQDDVGGGCGQLHYVQKWFDDHPKFARRSAGSGLPIVHAPEG